MNTMESEINVHNPMAYGYNNKQRFYDMLFKTAEFFGLNATDMVSKSRKKEVSEARFMLWRHAYHTGHYSIAFMGEHTGKRHHTTVLNGFATMEALLKYDEIFQKTFALYQNFLLHS